ncbi:helix-turn-helix domain-containing protein [Tundrisphaera sp. TA3]|uniref:helix-turn-helix domain-containing protein n=1 Tax=Tundrisphaera sp. TA3 TaxID=3435775 RepID=UPI003EBCBBBA
MPGTTTGEGGDDQAPGVSGSLRRAIRDSGISISELSRRTGVARQAINRFLSGERGLTTETVDKLCEVLGLTLLPKKVPEVAPPPTRPEPVTVRRRSFDTIDILRCKLFLIQLDDKAPLASLYHPVWSDILNRTRRYFPLYAFLMEVKADGSDKQRVAVQCLVLSILEMNPRSEQLMAHEHLPGFLRYLVTQNNDPICIGSLGAILDTNDLYRWFSSLPDPEPDPEDDMEEWIG